MGPASPLAHFKRIPPIGTSRPNFIKRTKIVGVSQLHEFGRGVGWCEWLGWYNFFNQNFNPISQGIVNVSYWSGCGVGR